MQIEQAQQPTTTTTSDNMPELIELEQLTEAMKKEQDQIPAIRAARESDDYFQVDPYSLLKEEARLQSLTASVRRSIMCYASRQCLIKHGFIIRLCVARTRSLYLLYCFTTRLALK